MYESVYFNGISVGFATGQILGDVAKNDGSYPQNFDVVVIYDTPYVTDEEFQAIERYGTSGGQIIMDSKSLLFNEYGQTRDNSSLEALKNLSTVTVKEGVTDLGDSAMNVVKQSGHVPEIQVVGNDLKGVIWRVVESDQKRNSLLTVMNVKDQPVTFDITGYQGKIVDRFTGKEVSGASVTMDVNEVLFFELGTVEVTAQEATGNPYQPAVGVTLDGGRTVLVWEEVSGVESYNIYQTLQGETTLVAENMTANEAVFTADQFANETKVTEDKTSSFNHIVMMLDGGDYEFTVKAVVSGVELQGTPHSISVHSTGVQEPINPTKVTAVGSTTENYVVDLTWEGATAQSYSVYEKINGEYVLLAEG